MDDSELKNIIEAAILAAGHPLSMKNLLALFPDPPPRDQVLKAINELGEEYRSRGIEMVEVASGFRIQVRQQLAPWISRLWEERPPRYSRALLETLALIAYRQPITRGEIEEIRGVSVSTSIMKTLLEREWVRVVGHRDVPGRPAMYATTREFLDHFDLKALDELPTLEQLRDIDSIDRQLDLQPEQDEQDDKEQLMIAQASVPEADNDGGGSGAGPDEDEGDHQNATFH